MKTANYQPTAGRCALVQIKNKEIKLTFGPTNVDKATLIYNLLFFFFLKQTLWNEIYEK